MANIAQAGGVVFKADQPSPRVLIVRAKRNPQLWIFPKGHIENGETPREAALRETREEAGVDGQIVDHLAAMEYESPRGVVEVEYYLVAWTADVPASEERERRWCTVGEAVELLTFDGAKDLLAKALRAWNDERISRLP